MATTYIQGSWFSQLWIYTTWGCFHTSFSFPGCLVSEKKIFKEILYIFLCKTSTPQCGLTLPPGVMIFTTLNLHYLRMLPHKFQLSWLSGSWEEDFWKFLEIFHYFLIISPFKRVWPLIFTTLNPLCLRMICAKFGWNWPSSSWEDVENVNGQTDGQTDDRQNVIRIAHLSFQLRWAKNDDCVVW